MHPRSAFDRFRHLGRSSGPAFWSGGSRVAWAARLSCHREGHSQPQFYSWKRKLRLREEATTLPGRWHQGLQFVPVEVKSTTTEAPLEMVLAGDRVVRVPSGYAAALALLLAVLERGAC